MAAKETRRREARDRVRRKAEYNSYRSWPNRPSGVQGLSDQVGRNFDQQ